MKNTRGPDLATTFFLDTTYILCKSFEQAILELLQEQFTFFTNFGVESVELVAPGQSILSFLVEHFCGQVRRCDDLVE